MIEAARSGNYPAVERILSIKPKKPGPFASLRRAQVIIFVKQLVGKKKRKIILIINLNLNLNSQKNLFIMCKINIRGIFPLFQ